MEKEFKIKGRVPGKITMFYSFIFVLSDLFIWIPASSLKIINSECLGLVLRSWQYWVFLIVKYQTIGFVYMFIEKAVLTYKGDEKSKKRFDLAFRLAEKAPLWMEGTSIIIMTPVLTSLLLPYHGNGVFLESVSFIHMGSGAIVSTLMFVYFIDAFETWVNKIVPFDIDSKIYLNSRHKSTLVVAIDLIALVFITISILLPLQQEPLTVHYLISSILPNLFSCCAVAVLSTSLLFKNNKISVNNIASVMKKVAANDYTADLGFIKSRDDYGQLSVAVNTFVRENRKLLESIQTNASSSMSMAKQLAVHADITSSAVEKIMESTDAMNESVLSETQAFMQMKEKASSIADSIESLVNNIDAQSVSVTESGSAIEEMVGNIRSVSSILDKNSVAVKNLSDAAIEGKKNIAASVDSTSRILKDSVGLLEASTVIQNIAEQTNLLSMNAAIEAAHAGETGKGFAVVANEIRKLAEDSNKQGKVITDSLQKLQETIKEIGDNTNNVQQSFNTIFDLTQTVESQEVVVKAAMNEQAAGSEQVLKAVQQITEITSEVKDNAKQMEMNNKLMGEDLHVLEKETENFNVTMNLVSKSAAEISRATNDTSMATTENNAMIEKLSSDVSRFKI